MSRFFSLGMIQCKTSSFQAYLYPSLLLFLSRSICYTIIKNSKFQITDKNQ